MTPADSRSLNGASSAMFTCTVARVTFAASRTVPSATVLLTVPQSQPSRQAERESAVIPMAIMGAYLLIARRLGAFEAL